MQKQKIVLIDGHKFARKQIAKALKREPSFMLVAEAGSSAEGYLSARINHPDIVLIDPFMSDGLGLILVARIARELPEIKQVVLSAVVDIAAEIELRNLGVCRILAKDAGSKALIETLKELVKV